MASIAGDRSDIRASEPTALYSRRGEFKQNRRSGGGHEVLGNLKKVIRRGGTSLFSRGQPQKGTRNLRKKNFAEERS